MSSPIGLSCLWRESTSKLLRQPWLLIYPPGGIGLIWSPKSACTTALLWYLANAGFIEDAAAYDPWPHNYRMNVLPELDVYKQWRTECDLDKLKWIRVMRDPSFRAVSSYRHALQYGFENTSIQEVLGLSVDGRGFSFSEFLDYLDKIDIATCNPHHAQQWHAAEARLAMTRVVNVDKEPLLEVLCDFSDPGEQARKVLSAEVARIADLHHAHRVPSESDCSAIIFQASETTGDWPDYEAFLNHNTRNRIERIYRKDFEAYSLYI